MGRDGQLGTIVPLRKNLGESSDPFARFSRAGLTNARFWIDGRAPGFWGYHRPDAKWNGWAKPRFIREVTGLIADWVNDNEAGSAWWIGTVLHVRSDEGVDEVHPDELGLYAFDGWIWLEVDMPE